MPPCRFIAFAPAQVYPIIYAPSIVLFLAARSLQRAALKDKTPQVQLWVSQRCALDPAVLNSAHLKPFFLTVSHPGNISVPHLLLLPRPAAG